MLHGDADIGETERRRIIDAVADHRDDMALALQLPHDVGLVGGQHVGVLAREAKPLADRAGDHGVVAGEHDGVLDA